LGASTTITHAILTIAAVVLAASFAFTIILKTTSLTSSISQLIFSEENSFETKIAITYVTYSPSKECFQIYVKNIGYNDISPDAIKLMDVYLGSYYGPLQLYPYNSSASPGYWNYTKTDSTTPSWGTGETIVLNLYNNTLVSPPYHVKVVLPSGVGDEYVSS
jgi:flagellar protein FlaG